MNSVRSRKLKVMSESEFRNLSGKSGLAPTKPEEDENGWDFFIEFPRNNDERYSLDEQPPSIKCLVQIKATDNLSKSGISISVANLDCLARSILPAFVFVFSYNYTDDVKRVYCCHLNENRISSVLKKVRSLSAKGIKDLHKHRMSFKVDEAEYFEFSGPAAIKSVIEKHTGKDLAAYSAKKSLQINTLGFSDKPIIFRFSSNTEIDEFVNAMLGYGNINVTKASVSRKRFGIEKLDHTIDTGKLTVNPIPVGHCEIRATSLDSGDHVDIEADIIAPGIPGLPFKHWKLRVCTFGVDAIIAGKSHAGSISIKIENDKVFKFDDLRKISSFASFISGKNITIEFRQKKKTFAQTETMTLEKCDYHEILSKRVEAVDALIIKGRFREQLMMAPQDILDDDDFRWIYFASQDDERSIEWTHDIDVPLHETEGTLKMALAVKCDKKHLLFLCSWRAKFLCKSQKIKATVKNTRIHYVFTVGKDDLEMLTAQIAEFQNDVKDPNEARMFLGPDPLTLLSNQS